MGNETDILTPFFSPRPLLRTQKKNLNLLPYNTKKSYNKKNGKKVRNGW